MHEWHPFNTYTNWNYGLCTRLRFVAFYIVYAVHKTVACTQGVNKAVLSSHSWLRHIARSDTRPSLEKAPFRTGRSAPGYDYFGRDLFIYYFWLQARLCTRLEQTSSYGVPVYARLQLVCRNRSVRCHNKQIHIQSICGLFIIRDNLKTIAWQMV
jgi:hypothetical protein